MTDDTQTETPAQPNEQTTAADVHRAVEEAQAIADDLGTDVPGDAFVQLENVTNALEVLDDKAEAADGNLPEGFEDDIETVQDEIGTLQEELVDADGDLFRRAKDLDHAVESIEAAVAGMEAGYGVKVGNHPVEFFDEETPTAREILSRFGEATDDVLVEADTENQYSGASEVPLGGPGIERFTAEPATDGSA